MAGISRIVAVLGVVGVALGATPAWACGSEEGGTCHCQHSQDSKSAKKAGEKKEAEKKVEAAAAAVDAALAAKCSCSSAADCTCKKGECKCPKCRRKTPLFDALKGAKGTLVLPKEAGNNATAGIFI
jgi:hypothetical protein